MKAGTRETHLELLCLCGNEPLTRITRLISTSSRLTSYPHPSSLILSHSLPPPTHLQFLPFLPTPPLPSPSPPHYHSIIPSPSSLHHHPFTITPYPAPYSPTLTHPIPLLTLVALTIFGYLFPVPEHDDFHLT
ncbi:hypothetical protein Pcinc_036871 [Petrolisthes cinctipes]|uniref:Uncharacterized protein n=1 Tax=Petrolisthes cinctipes TaxID=88211 RepID=A0AAE1EPC3_PETCI|nr:hypothetical protein Pcinc_036871 [Petrolisthes cinctipes]